MDYLDTQATGGDQDHTKKEVESIVAFRIRSSVSDFSGPLGYMQAVFNSVHERLFFLSLEEHKGKYTLIELDIYPTMSGFAWRLDSSEREALIEAGKKAATEYLDANL
jgi:hypothetical protein